MGNEKQDAKISDGFLFQKIFQTFRMSIQLSKLIIAFLAIVIICLAGRIMDLSKTVVTTPLSTDISTELQIYITNPEQLPAFIEGNKETGMHRGVFSTLWPFSSARFHGILISLLTLNMPSILGNIVLYLRALEWAIRYHFLYCSIFFIIKSVVICLAGGAICRIAALQFARGEKPGLIEALRFSIKKFTSFFAVPLVPIVIIIFIALFVFLLGLISNIPVAGELITAVCLPAALILGALIATILIGAVAGFNLMFPAIAYDGSDCFDAISRSFSYIYSKPWRMGFYTVMAMVYGALCYTFVRFFVFLLLSVTHWFLQLGVFVNSSSKEVNKLAVLWPQPNIMNLFGSLPSTAANWSESSAAFLVHLFMSAVICLVVSFVISFYFSANTIIYSLMRKEVDNTDLEIINTEQ